MTRGAFWNCFTGRWEERGGDACWETDGERDGEIARQRKSRTQGIFWGRERETEKRIRPIEAWHDRVSDDGCLCISHCLHQRHRNTTHTHSASSYKHRCSPIKAAVRTEAISGLPSLFVVGGSHPLLDQALLAPWKTAQENVLSSFPLEEKNWPWFNKQFTQETYVCQVKPLDRIQLSRQLNFLLQSLSISDKVAN